MPLLTIVQHYIFAALMQAVAEEQGDGTVVATVPVFPGLVAYGRDSHECASECYRLIEETVRNWLKAGYELPVIDGIDLNSEKGKVLASYHQQPSSAETETYYDDEDALTAAFENFSASG